MSCPKRGGGGHFWVCITSEKLNMIHYRMTTKLFMRITITTSFRYVCRDQNLVPPKIYCHLVDIYIDAYIYIYIYIYVIYTRYDMILCCKLVEYIESRPVDIKCCLVASRNTAKLWATHGYAHMIAKLSDQTPFWRPQNRGRH